MPRVLSSTALQAAFAQDSSEAFIILLTINHPSMGSPIRVASNALNFVSRGNTFVAFPFMISLPDDREDQVPTAQLTIDNVDRTIVAAIRLLLSPPTVLIEVVTASHPDTVEVSWSMWLRDIQYDALTVQGNMRFEEILSEPFPGDSVTPSTLPGAFEVF